MAGTDVLAERAASYRKQILDTAHGPGGMIISFTRFDTRAPFQEGEESPCPSGLADAWGKFTPRPTEAEWVYGENTLWATGWFLWSQILRYRVTGEEEARATARKCFLDLHHLFRLCAEIEPGLLGKPHGGRPGPTVSFDQSACPILFYVMYAQDLASPEEKAEATRNMALHGDWYLRRNWVMNHHGNLARVVDPAHTSTMKYLACVHAAYEMTGEKRFQEAAFRYLRQILANDKLPWPTDPYETNHNLYYWSLLCDYWSKTEIAGEADWIGFIRQYWQAAQTAIDPEGLHRFGHYSVQDGSFTPYPDRWLTAEDAKEWPSQAPRQVGRRWVSSTALGNRSLNSACNAALGLLARSHGLDDEAHRLAQKGLLRMDDDTLRWLMDDGKLPEELKASANWFAPEVVAMWLVAYWMGRQQGVW